jgi:hypothetical protein
MTDPERMAKTGPDDTRALADEAIKDHRKIRSIVSLLYDDDLERRFTAVKALARSGAHETAMGAHLRVL